MTSKQTRPLFLIYFFSRSGDTMATLARGGAAAVTRRRLANVRHPAVVIERRRRRRLASLCSLLTGVYTIWIGCFQCGLFGRPADVADEPIRIRFGRLLCIAVGLKGTGGNKSMFIF